MRSQADVRVVSPSIIQNVFASRFEFQVCAIWGGFYASGSALGPLATGPPFASGLRVWATAHAVCTPAVVVTLMALMYSHALRPYGFQDP